MKIGSFAPAVFLGALIVLAGGIAGFGAARRVTAANDASGCVGLSDYRAAMFKIGRAYRAATGDLSYQDQSTFTAADFKFIADRTAREVDALTAVTPPAFARSWHEAYVAREELVQQSMLAAAQRGLYATTLFKSAIDYATTGVEDGLGEASATCGDFAVFAQDFTALAGSINGTPIATPTR